MPEIAEIETARRSVAEALEGVKIIGAKGSPDPLVFDKVAGPELAKYLIGRTVTGTDRKGKYFWLKLDTRPWLVLHFGMSGWWYRHRTEDRPLTVPHCKLELIGENGEVVFFTDPRRFGRIRLNQDPLTELPISRLGYDALGEFPSAKGLHVLLAKRAAPIKAVLLDQKLFAGVGNWIADEVLFQAEIRPAKLANRLSLAEVTKMRSSLLRIVKKAVDVSADSEKFPKHWLFHHRWGKVEGSETAGGHAIKHSTIGGRTTAWVPKLQR